METRQVEYNLPAHRIPRIVEKLEETKRRAEKKGLGGFITYQVGEIEINTYQDTDYFGRVVEKVVETRTLLYVAMTRAKHRLVIPYVVESEFIRRMKKSLRA